MKSKNNVKSFREFNEMRKTLTDLYNEYSHRCSGKPKHSFSHFIRIISMIDHHRTHIRPKIKWWSNIL